MTGPTKSPKEQGKNALSGQTDRRGLLFVLFAAVIGQLFGSPWPGLYGLALALSACALWEPPVLKRLGSFKLWIALLLVATAVALLSKGASSDKLTLRLTTSGLEAGLVLVCRALTLYAAALVVTRHVSHRSLSAWLARLGLRRMGMALGLAVNVMPLLVDTAQEAMGQLRMRQRGQRIGPLTRLVLVARTLLLRAATLADEAAFAESLKTEGPKDLRSQPENAAALEEGA